MKRLFSLMMALVLVLSLSVTAFAAQNTGTITIKNATIGQTYRLFKIFNASPAENDPNKVSYTIDSSNIFYNAMFGTYSDGQAANIFDYNAETGGISLKSGVIESQVLSYMTKLIAEFVDKEGLETGKKVNPTTTKPATSSELKFEDLEPGYYVIDRGIKTVITLDTNTPDVTVIDKNQKPGGGFDKDIVENGVEVESNSAGVGDVLKWDISFEATNYAGKELVEYYSVRDTKDSALWVEFNDIKVSIVTKDADGKDVIEPLEKGYYFYAGDPALNTNEWTLFGNGWTAEQRAKAEEEIENGNNAPRTLYKDEANWYLVHYGYDEFEIVIPWLQPHTFVGKTDPHKGYEITFTRDANGNIEATSKYDPTVTVHITYTASVGPGASLEGAENTANLSWKTVSNTYTPDDPQKTETHVYNMSITKVANDGGEGKEATPLANAVFELYRDEACTDLVYVIPTGETGVYILDDVFNILSGEKRVSSRVKYTVTLDDGRKEEKWRDYIEETYIDENGNEVKYAEEVTKVIDGETVTASVRGDMTTPESGQLIILGLEAGTYYLKETKAPKGYNQLAAPVEVKVAVEGSTAGQAVVGGYNTIVYTAQIVNNQGFELPSTGAEGTMMLITLGTLITIGFAVLLITQKKMTTYRD